MLGITILTCLGSGCLYLGESRRTEVDEAARIAVRFESAQAARDFQQGLAQSDQDTYTDRDTFAMPFLAAREETTYHETAHYNAAVRLADIDRDGNITETEARAYRDHVEQEDE